MSMLLDRLDDHEIVLQASRGTIRIHRRSPTEDIVLAEEPCTVDADDEVTVNRCGCGFTVDVNGNEVLKWDGRLKA